MKVNEIIEKYNSGAMNLEEANKALKEAGANFHLEPSNATAGWTEQEMKEGFFNPEDRGFEHKPVYPDRPDTSRRHDLAGQVVRQITKMGTYDVHYNENGYAVKSVRVN